MIEQLKETCATIAEGRRGNSNFTVPECLKNTLTLNEQALLDTFEKESVSYEARRRKVEFEVSFSPGNNAHHVELFRAAIGEALKVASPKPINVSEASFSRPKLRGNITEDSNEWDNSIAATLPI